ncbi:MAG: lysophospholipid acyltransferase family protein [Candidatus Polarisedimenticolia bacterium]
MLRMSRRRLRVLLIPPAASLLIRVTRWTMRVRHVGREAVETARGGGRPYIHAFWHGHLFLMPYAYRGRGISILISEHADGEIIARTMGWFGHASIRGSTTSGGAAALRRAVQALRAGRDLGFTPDGPRGPRRRAQIGVIQAARLGGAAIVPVAFAASPSRILGSWDAFVLPYPFSRGVFVYGAPMEIPPDAGREDMEAARHELETRLNDLTASAVALAGGSSLGTKPGGERSHA